MTCWQDFIIAHKAQHDMLMLLSANCILCSRVNGIKDQCSECFTDCVYLILKLIFEYQHLFYMATNTESCI